MGKNFSDGSKSSRSEIIPPGVIGLQLFQVRPKYIVERSNCGIKEQSCVVGYDLVWPSGTSEEFDHSELR